MLEIANGRKPCQLVGFRYSGYDVYFRYRTGAWKCDVMCMALSSTPRYAVVVYNIEMYGSVSLLCIFDNYRVNYHE